MSVTSIAFSPTIDLNNCDIDFDDSLKIELGIKSNLMFYEIQDYVDEYVFSDLDCKILVNGEEIDNYIESESFGIDNSRPSHSGRRSREKTKTLGVLI